ncbi:sensor histidine kinase [Paenibacillus hexagrammi]|uniref:histidine kinase n=1 Tax=Paenibacillus hexagrammi TaxID=2908839 RepID=A0ABY3SMV3_9BACL|nr:histidine kinase [Paenibacillus sp. YPD9-1]UJF34865.1 histidine kinase [Paenibacillus sp. YPD9-1]
MLQIHLPDRVPDRVRSLRRTLVVYLMIACLLPLALVGVLTYYSTYSILTGKIESGVRANLSIEAASLENAINNLDFASKQFALDGQIVAEVTDYMQERDVYKKTQLMSSINAKINLVNFTNPNLGLTAYISPEASDPILFTNLNLKGNLNLSGLPEFIHYNGANYYGPHRTLYNYSENIVFSEQREIRTSDNKKLIVYLETNYNLFRKILNSNLYGMKVSHLLVNQDGEITFIEDADVPAQVIQEERRQVDTAYFEYDGYKLFRYTSPQGWQLLTVVSKATFDSEIYTWLRNMIILTVTTLGFAMLLAYFIWKRVYHPLRHVNQEIVRMAKNRSAPVSLTNVLEFDTVLRNFQKMKTTVNELIDTVSLNEKRKSELEIEKLLNQINPHFLHNTLNSVQWLARMNGQKEIDQLVTLLVKVLHYNLGKQSLIVTIKDEIDALKNYMELQKIRYDYEFDFHISVDEDILSVAVPRFLLQPLVENAIYHGMNESNGRVDVSIELNGEGAVLLKVEDNGSGMDAEALQRMLSDDGAKMRGLGIGLSYVKRMLDHYYREHMTFHIDSEIDRGTTITIIIPKKIKGDMDDQSHRRG